jgi:hypothetical protein
LLRDVGGMFRDWGLGVMMGVSSGVASISDKERKSNKFRKRQEKERKKRKKNSHRQSQQQKVKMDEMQKKPQCYHHLESFKVSQSPFSHKYNE